MKTRYATEDDLYRIAEMTRAPTLHHGAFVWSVENHLNHVRRRFSIPRYIHLVAEEDGHVIGFTGAELQSGRTAYMMRGFVEPTQRRKGVMRQLEGKLVEILRERGVTKIDLLVDSNNQEGKATWTALGYETIRETMRKQIQSGNRLLRKEKSMQSSAKDVDTYMTEVERERRESLARLRELCLETLVGYEESMEYGMPSY